MRQLRRCSTVGIALGAMLFVSGASVAYADDTHIRRGVNPAVTSGLVMFGVLYGASVIVAATSDHQGDKRLYVPLLGPWLDLGDRGSCGVQNQSCDTETAYKVLLVADGVLQAAAVLAIVSGVLSPRHEVTTQAFRIRVLPVTFARGAPGVAAFGRF